MAYRSLLQCVTDLERNGHLVRISAEMDPNLEMAEIQRRVYEAQGPALLFENVKGSPFRAASNLFGTLERSRFIFRDTIEAVSRVIALKAHPEQVLKHPFSHLGLPFKAIKALPLKKSGSWGGLFGKAPVLFGKTSIDQLPQIKSWPMDGGPFITLPQVYTEDLDAPGPMKSNLGMYRVQIGGNEYIQNKEIGLHYQIQRGIGVHHSKAIARDQDLRVSIFVGGPPSHTFSAVMPLPEGLPEIMFAGMLGGRNWRHQLFEGHRISADADFCIVGRIRKGTKPEGPFGDHLGYYSLVHEFPVLEVEAVYHRKNAIWPFTVVGRPPQEDTSFGALIHEMTAPAIPSEIPGLRALHAVDAAGVHPLLLAIGSERYVPYAERQPQEILTIANAILGFNQVSLAKYLLIVTGEDNPMLDIHDEAAFFRHLLERFNPERDLHFQTKTTIDTLDYSGMGYNYGSKVVIAAAGLKIRELSTNLPENLKLPDGYKDAKLVFPGVFAISGPKFSNQEKATLEMQAICEALKQQTGSLSLTGLPLGVVCDDALFTASKLKNFLWVTFTRSNPSHDVYGVDSFTEHKHWGCKGPLLIDARIKPHHAPPLIEDPKITARVDSLAAKGGPLAGLF